MASFLSLPAATTALLLLLFLSLSLPTPISSSKTLQLMKSGRTLLSFNDEDLDSPTSKSKTPPKKKPISESIETKNKTKLLKTKKTNSTISSSTPTFSTTSTKSKLNKTLTSTKLNKTFTAIPAAPKSKLNKTAIAGTKTNTTKFLKPIKLLKSNSTKIALPKSNSTKIQQPKSPNLSPKTQKNPETKEIESTPKAKKPNASPANWLDDTHITGAGDDDDDDLISEFRELPSRLHSALVPDLEKLSTTSKLYISKTHREIAAGVKPFVGKKYAPSIASAASAALLVLPLLLVMALFRQLIRTGSSASLHRALLFVQAYLAIYFATLSLTAVVTGLEPLRFFYAVSPRSYAWTQALQTFGYVVYLIAQLITMVVAFSASEGEGATGKAVCLAQMLLGLAVGMHYYTTVFHRAVTGEAPRANWKVHGIYAACFVVICGLGRAERRKKAYLQDDGGDDGKKS